MILDSKIAGHVLSLGIDCEWMAEEVREYIEKLERENSALRSEFGRVALAFKRGESRHQMCLDIANYKVTPNDHCGTEFWRKPHDINGRKRHGI